MISSDFNFKIIHLDSVVSTNIYALELLQKENISEGQIIWADFQEKGKGQKDNLWHSERGKNLIFSLVLKPNLPVSKQFDLSKIVSLGVVKALDSLAVGELKIKWPNDILLNKEKIGGILIENSVLGSFISTSVIGIGLNINQTDFPVFSRKANSLTLASGLHYNVEEILFKVAQSIKEEYILYKENNTATHQLFLEYMYGRGDRLKFIDSQGKFEATIVGVQTDGRLQVNKNGKLKMYGNKEIVFLK